MKSKTFGSEISSGVGKKAAKWSLVFVLPVSLLTYLLGEAGVNIDVVTLPAFFIGGLLSGTFHGPNLVLTWVAFLLVNFFAVWLVCYLVLMVRTHIASNEPN